MPSAVCFAAEFFDFQPDINIPRNDNDGLRSWSMNIVDTNGKLEIIENEKIENNSKRIITNATRIIHDFSFCIVQK